MTDRTSHDAIGRTGRRQVLRAGAWAAPAVTIAAAAPAYAASVSHLKWDNLTLYGADWSGGKPTSLELNLEIQHVWAAGAPTPSSVTVMVSVPDTRVDGTNHHDLTGTGWSFIGAAHVGSSWVYTFTYSGSVPPGGNTGTLRCRVSLISNAPGTISISGTAIASGVGSASASATYTIR